MLLTGTGFYEVKQVSQMHTGIQIYNDNEHRPHNSQYGSIRLAK